MTWSLINAEVAYDALSAIDADPRSLDMESWGFRTACGTTLCFGGHVVVRNLSPGDTLRWSGDMLQGVTTASGDFIPVGEYARAKLGLRIGDGIGTPLFLAFSADPAGLRAMVDALVAGDLSRFRELAGRYE